MYVSLATTETLGHNVWAYSNRTRVGSHTGILAFPVERTTNDGFTVRSAPSPSFTGCQYRLALCALWTLPSALHIFTQIPLLLENVARAKRKFSRGCTGGLRMTVAEAEKERDFPFGVKTPGTVVLRFLRRVYLHVAGKIIIYSY